MNIQRLLPIAVFSIVLLVILMMALGSVIYTVDEREQAVVVQFGDPVAARTDAGLYFKIPLIQEVRRFPKTLQFWRSTASTQLTDLPAADGKKIEVSAWAVWRITDPKTFVKQLRTIDRAEEMVVASVRGGIRDIITRYDLSQVVRSTNREMSNSFEATLGTDQIEAAEINLAPEQKPIQADKFIGRQQIMGLIIEQIHRELKTDEDGVDEQRGIQIVDVGISNIEFVPSVREAAFQRLITTMEEIAARYTNEGERRKKEIINETNAEVEKLIGEGEEQSNIIRGKVDAENIGKYAAAITKTGEFYNFIRTLDVYKRSLRGKTRLILTTDSDLLKLLTQEGQAPAKTEPPAVTKE